MSQPGTERIVVALDASPQSQIALRAAAKVAAAMQAELQGLFVEDVNLFYLCNSPFCREVGLRTAMVRQLESHTVERQLRVRAAELRRLLARVASEAQVRWSFQVTRGAIVQELLTAAEDALLLSLGRTGWLAGNRLGSTTRVMVERTLRPLLILGEHDGLTPPLTVVYNGTASADRAVALATRLAQQAGNQVIVWLVGPASEAAAWQEHVPSLLQGQSVALTFVHFRIEELASALAQAKNHSFFLPLDYAEWLTAINGPVLLVP
ncbi:MAG: universal stress protein [Caldilineaceae bacterium]|nr:universal stress protein [Caldilineaceae bacterium]